MILPSLLISLAFLQTLGNDPRIVIRISRAAATIRRGRQLGAIGQPSCGVRSGRVERGVERGAQGQHRKLLLSWSRRTWRMKSKTDETALQDMLCAALHAAECPA
jgi:hypothetical protein